MATKQTPKQAPKQAPAAVAPVAPVAVAVRGAPAIVAIAPGAKAYRVQAGHNATWWAQCTAAMQAGGGVAAVPALLAAGVPSHFVGYVVRCGYAKPAPAATA